MRNKNNLARVLAPLVLAPLSGHAQLLDTLLPAAIPGYGETFSVVAAHRQFAPGATGWNFGTITAAPSLALAAGYDSAPGGAAGSLVLQSTPSLLLADPTAGFALYAQTAARATPQDRAQNIVNSLVAAGERVELPRETITIAAAYLRNAATGFAFSPSAINRPIIYTVQNLRLSDEIHDGFFTLTPELSLSRDDFTAIARGASRTELRAGATFGFTQGGPVTALLQVNANARHERLATQNAWIGDVLTGVQWQQDGLWTVSFLAGAAMRAPAVGHNLIAPVVEARADWRPTALDQLSLSVSREINDPDAIAAAPYTRTSIKLAITHECPENITIKLLGDFAAAQYMRMGLNEFLANGIFNLQWRATPALSVTMDYSFDTRQANQFGAANEHIATLGLIWTP